MGTRKSKVPPSASERAIEDINLREFVRDFFSPYNKEDSLEFMCKELINLKRGDELKARREVVKEVIEKPQLRKELEKAVKELYSLKDFMSEHIKFTDPRFKSLIFLDRKETHRIIKLQYNLLKTYQSLIKRFSKLDCESAFLSDLKKACENASKEEIYKTSEMLVETLENWGEAKLHVFYDYFDNVKNVGSILFTPKEKGARLRKILKTIYSKVAPYIPFIGLIAQLKYMLWATREERFLAESLCLLIDQQPFINEIIEKRKELDFLCGGARYVEKIKAAGLPLIFPTFGREDNFIIRELYNPCLLLQPHIKNAKDIVPNDVEYLPQQNVTIITGANNTGKSIYVKSIGLAYSLAQNGFPISAKNAQLMELNALYTHFLHPEDIELGEGSYLDELRRMKELFQKADRKSLVIIDEPIRGSSPEDAEEMSLRFIKGLMELGAPTFLTTHLHSVAERAEGLAGVRNFYTEVKIEKTEIKPTYRIKPGRAGKSYGIEIADRYGLKESDIFRMVKRKKQT